MRPFANSSCSVARSAAAAARTPRALRRCCARRGFSSLSSVLAVVSRLPPGPPHLRRGGLKLPHIHRWTTRTGAPTTHAARCFIAKSPDANNGLHSSGDEEGSLDSAKEGLDSAELLFLDDLAEGDTGNAAAPSASSSSSRTAPQTEPTSASARAALQQRRELFARCTDLHSVVHEEVRAEVARDMKDGVAAVPPLAPAGWRVLHPSGSSYFTMTRVETGYYADGRHGAASTVTDSTPRYQSVRDMMTGRSGAPRRSREKVSAAPQRGTHFLRGNAANAGDGAGRVRYARSDTHITLFAPFRTLDLTLYDPHVDICEWARFDVLMRKTRPATAAESTSTANSRHASSTAASSSSSRASQQQPSVTPLQGQQEIWDEGRCMFLRLACVNSELRIRSVQFVSNTLARALEEHAVFGKGEPLYLELLRRQRRERAVAQADGKTRWHTTVSPLNVFDAPRSSASPAAAAASTLLEDPLLSTAAADGASVLTSQFDRSGEYARTFAYAGPYLTELSKELREALQGYVMLHLGITSEVAEYVCQMQFFLEQEEYIAWLAQWGQLATTLRGAL